jgi:hypothetical protein
MSQDIASRLLHSTDSRIAEAAARVFSSHPATASSLTPRYYYETEDAASTPDIHSGDREGKKCPISTNLDSATHEEMEEEEEDRKLSSTERLQRR